MSATMTPRPTRARAAAPQRAPQRPAARPDLRVVGPPRARARTGPIVALALVVVFASLLASAVLHSVLVSDQQRLDHLNEQISAQQLSVQQERLTVARYQSPAHIVRAAVALHMVVPRSTNWLQPEAKASQRATTTGGPSAGAQGR
ncbi:MAG TPA: hypothetical protein VGM93_13100 [Acidimicrobiales bacterium]